jgi:hypothetical protein
METKSIVTAHSIAYLESALEEVKKRLSGGSKEFLATHLVVIKDALEELLYSRRRMVWPPVHPHPDPQHRCTCGPESRCSYCW